MAGAMVKVALGVLVCFLIAITASDAFFHRLKSIVKCGSFNRDYSASGACPRRCQFEYMGCPEEEKGGEGCVCREGSVWNYEMNDCIAEKECLDLEGPDVAFIRAALHAERKYTISCDVMNYCDLRKIRKEGKKLVDETPMPVCEEVDDKTVYWRGDSAPEVYYKGTSLEDCNRVEEKNQKYMMSLRRIWEEDYKDEELD